MNRSSRLFWWLLIVLVFCAGLDLECSGVTPPVPRATSYDGNYSNSVFYAFKPWMNSNITVTVEGWVYCAKLTGAQTILARHFATNLWFGLNTNRLRFYRSGGVFADSDGMLLPLRWTHVAASYDGARVRFYTNGVLAGNKLLANSGNNSTNSLSLGGQHDVQSLGDIFAGGYPFNGYLDEVRIWSVARSGTDIAANMLTELRTEPGLEASFGTGGGFDNTRSVSGSTAGIPVAQRVTGFGLLPRNLCIPYTRSTLTLDGQIDLLNEYRGAETAVIQYTTSLGGYEDRPAYLIVSTNASSYYLYVGIPNLAQSGSTIPSAQILCDISPDENGNLGNWDCEVAQDGLQGGTIVSPFPPPKGPPTRTGWGQSASSWQGITGGSAEFAQNYEFRIHGSHLNNFTSPVALMIRHHDVVVAGDQGAAPKSGNASQPDTWLPADWCGQADTALRTVSVSGAVLDNATSTGQSGWVVSLRSGANELTAFIVDTAVTSGAGGTFFLNGSVAKDLPFFVVLEPRNGFGYLPPTFAGSGSVPLEVERNLSLKYAACLDGACNAQNVLFKVVPPPGPVSVSGASAMQGAPEVVLRDTPRKVAPATIVTLLGSNLHDLLEVYLTKCAAWPSSFCTEGVDLFRMTVLSNDPGRGSITVQLPQQSPAFNGRMQWVLKDSWVSHPGWVQWVAGPTGFDVNVLNHPYASIWGFEFANEGDGTSLEEFESVYGDNVFQIVPFPPFKVRNPYYYGVWAPVFFAIGGPAGGNGSCHGMASLSRMFERGLVNVTTFDVPASGGPNGVHYPAGFLSTGGGSQPHPIKPSAWTGFDLFQAFRPVNLWSRIRSQMMMQFSTEGIDNALDQTSIDGGNPVAVVNRLRSNAAGHILCFNPGGFGGGHCITPLGIVDDFKLDDTDLAHRRVAAAGFSLIRVYDNNYPGEERLFEIDRGANRYRYLMGFFDGDGSRPDFWSGRSVFTTSLSFFTGGHTAPGVERILLGPMDFLIRFICSGGADVQHTDAAGGTWGWDAAGTFNNKIAGAVTQFPLYGYNTNRSLRINLGFFALTNPPVKSVINVRGTNYIFHAGRLGTTFQLIASNLPPGGTDLAVLDQSNQMPAALRFQPGRRIGSLIPQLAQVTANETVVYSLRYLALNAGHTIEWQSLPGKHGARLVNTGPIPLSYSFQVEGVDGTSGLVLSNRFGPFLVPSGASQAVTFPDWPQASKARSELDLGADGTVDEAETVSADRALRISREGGQIIVRWTNGSVADYLEQRDTLAPGAGWVRLAVPAQVDPTGGWRAAWADTGGDSFLRLRP